MTPHERAEQFLRDWRRTPGQEPMVEALEKAFEAHTADLRDLLAQQAARADEWIIKYNAACAERGSWRDQNYCAIAEAAAHQRARYKLTEERDAEMARADAAEAEVSRLQSELSEFQFDNGGILSSLAEQTRRADAALAQVTRYNEMAGKDADELARLRAALEPFAAMIKQDGSIDTMSMLYRWLVAINHVHVGSEILYASAVYDLSKAAQSALAGGDHE
jgi:hypothetical protein